jgi:3-deoxy-D-manno-octulosonate 8-phosphate phosphatase KdsC-like HAD superfamily phosphatase
VTPPEVVAYTVAWETARAELEQARQTLGGAPAGLMLQSAIDRVLAGERRCTELTHRWFAQALELQPVREPRLVFSLDVDGVLEDVEAGFSSTGLAGAAALRLLSEGRVAVIVNTARNLTDVRDRVAQFHLLGGVGSCGASLWDAVYGESSSLVSDRVGEQFNRLRAELRLDPELVLHPGHADSVRASRIVEGRPVAIPGPQARRLLDAGGLSEVSFLVAPTYTDFIDRHADKATGLNRLLQELGLTGLPLAAMGDASCDRQMLQAAQVAFVPAATLPGYAAARRQRLVRSRYLGDQALWEAACSLVPEVALQRRVAGDAAQLTVPPWFPTSLCRRLPGNGGFFPRLTATLASVRPN